MARVNSDPGSTTNSNPGGTTAPPPPPPPSAPTEPTGPDAFSVGEGSISRLQKYAADLESGYQGVSTQLSSQQLAVNALGVFGMPMAAAVNGSNSKSVEKAKQTAETMGKVNDGLRATSETQTNTDQFIADQFNSVVPDSGAKKPPGAPTSAPPPPAQSGPQVSKVEPPPGTTDPVPTAPPPPSGPQVSKFEPPPGAPDVTNPAGAPAPQGGPQVSQFTPPPGVDITSPAAASTPVGGPPVGQFTPPPGVGNVPPPSAPTPVGGPPVGQFTPPPGTTNAAAWTPQPIPDPVARIPGSTGPSGVTGPTMSNNAPNSSIISQMPNIPSANGPVPAPPDRPNIPRGRPTPGGSPRPTDQNSIGVTPPRGEFSRPSQSALDSLRPINTQFPPQGSAMPPRPDAPPPSPSSPLSPSGPFPPEPTPPIPNPDPKLPSRYNLFDLMDGTKDQHSKEQWPGLTKDGQQFTDLSGFTNLPPEQQQMWKENFQDLLKSKENGAFFWSGSLWDAQGERISVMYEAEEQAHGMGRNTLEGNLHDANIILPGWGADPNNAALWKSVSNSIAHGSSGEVYVLLGPSRRPDNVFDLNEFPILEKNEDVRKVIAIDLMNNNAETVILDKGPKPPKAT
jgi:hypothetical protein